MSHIYDMLGINIEKIKDKKKEKDKKSKKELNFLKENDNLFSLPTSSKTINLNNKNPSIWRLVKFKNKCRNDDLILKKWKKMGYKNDKIQFNENSIEDDYTFEKFNKKLNIVKYDDEFYNKQIKNMNLKWTKEETDYLFNLCEKYECHFIIIYDVYDTKYSRTIEELKDRFYSVSKKVVEDAYDQKIKLEESKKIKNNTDLIKLKEGKAKHPLVKFTYNMEADIERKNIIHKTYTISKKDVMLEEITMESIKKFESKIKHELKKVSDMKKLKKKFELTNDEIIPINKFPEDEKDEKNIYSAKYFFQKLKIDISYFDKLDIYLKENDIEKPTIYTENMCFLYGVLRTDVAILLNLRKKVEKLKQEREYWRNELIKLEEEYLKKKNKS
ncbi:conserved Plasmodium protein, unknown function [Plasmodium chabaudi chabaudi]|uniref:DNA methyltransferase 1-associated protein 1, putative n=2 Tax=Plasmodium chabaudi TaxID=5825 RepID=A0A077TQ60_PLACU|nr:DNA methyltransferase 1-associated protein 1, putative [Plasmodium chabaudi chabaudi]SCM22620.1 conserved Plasmodium protein, unknown function [Plasmodium chabaudi adami]SCM23830.1 conserved Plasmodium protein, unknown function [Plasmodium chabaudi chabaudi]SCN61287.1 conserved Plasmodium protein, unknown function [Plasmodium chabaudi adami]SCN61288.1 conserved Plasmodium protein, unknown function [Plasmodium chabaudi chabaudi]VTZ69263.1 DNA methyltransferase 1-associated protein 1, putativ|eukprot:XP_016654014.1 conserved Plasmodium protein, unknown function [Plasmodium chabaudi chabaudi]